MEEKRNNDAGDDGTNPDNKREEGGRVEIFQKRQDAPSALIVTNRDNNNREKHHTPIFISSGGK